MIIMAVDLGLARTGVALCDNAQTLAFPRTVIAEHNKQRLVEKLCVIAKEENAEQIVVGYPRNVDGSAGSRAEVCAEIANMIGEASGIRTVLRDERYTTVSAHIALNSADVRGKKRKAAVDAVAATIILQDYLDYLKNTQSGNT